VLPDTPVFAPGAGGGASAFAAVDTPSSPFDAFASFPSEALGYAKAPALKAASAVYADGSAVWAKGFGGQRVQGYQRRLHRRHHHRRRRRGRL